MIMVHHQAWNPGLRAAWESPTPWNQSSQWIKERTDLGELDRRDINPDCAPTWSMNMDDKLEDDKMATRRYWFQDALTEPGSLVPVTLDIKILPEP